MKAIVPPGYAVPKKEIERLVAEARQARADELAKSSDADRARIEKEIEADVRKRIGLEIRLRRALGGPFEVPAEAAPHPWRGWKAPRKLNIVR